MAEQFPQMLVGAGTVLTTEQVDRAVAAGAKFIVSPGLNPKVVKYCIEKGVPVTPGTANPSDVEQAIELGLEVDKFLPGRGSRRTEHDQVHGSTLHKHEIHAYRRNQCKEYQQLSCIS